MFNVTTVYMAASEDAYRLTKGGMYRGPCYIDKSISFMIP